MKRWVETWKKAGPELERIRDQEVRESNTAEGIRALGGVATMALRDYPPEPTSGLVEQQRWFRKLHKR